jgi:hypothetical protein
MMAQGTAEVREETAILPRTMFVDDYDIASGSGVERVIHPGEKYEGNPVLSPHEPWLERLHIGGTVRLENGLYRSWYHGRGQKRGDVNLYAESDDGVHWRTPTLRQYEDETGSLENNIYLSRLALRSNNLTTPNAEPGLGLGNQDIHPSILYTPHMGEGRTYTLLSFDYGRSGYGAYDGYYLAFSEDGIRWTDGPEEPVIPGHSDVGYFLYDEPDKKFRGIVKSYLDIRGWRRRSVLWTESEDVFNWTMPRPAIIPDLIDEEWTEGRDDYFTQFYGMPIVRYESMILAFLQVFRCTDNSTHEGTIDVQLVSSRDGRRWNRVGDRRTILEGGAEGEWDWGEVRTGNSFVLDGDVIKAYYSGMNFSHSGHTRPAPHTPHGGPKTGDIGFATWPRDRFVGMKSGSAGGKMLVTQKRSGAELHVNANAAGGSLVAEIVEHGGPVPGFEASNCLSMSEDSLDHVMRWQGDPALAQLDGRAVDVRLNLTNAEVFSLWWE